MADNSSRSLLTPEYSKTRSAYTGQRSTYKTPLVIFSLLALLIGCIVASVTILLKSHEDPVKSWRVQPSVLLSFLSGVYAVALGGLFATGVAITWWRSITHGTTLTRLHFISARANPKDLFLALLAGSDARRVALAALIVFIVKISVGPVTQRSTRPRPHDVSRNVDMNIRLAQEIRDGYLGIWGDVYARTVRDAQGTFLNSSINTELGNGYFCAGNGTCEGVVSAAGINFACPTSTETIDLLDARSQGSTVFMINMTMDYSFGQPMIFMMNKYIESVDESCIATLRTDTCNIIPATVRYPIRIKNSTLTLDLEHFLEKPDIVTNYTSAADITNKDRTAPIGPLIGMFKALNYAFVSESLLSNNSIGGISYKPSTDPLKAFHWPNLFVDTSLVANSSMQEKCLLAWRSPTMPLIGYMYDFMFRAASSSANKDTDKQTFNAVYRGTELWYVTNFRWLAASIAIMILGNVAAMSLLWGWWQLDRYVTLSPLETGKAFGAPIFAAAGSEQEANSILKEVGHERVANDGDELVWSGSVYASGTAQASSLRGRVSGDADGTSAMELEAGSSGHSSTRGRGHRRGFSSVSESEGPRPSFEHSLGYTTRAPYDEEEEVDIGFGRQRSGSGSGSGNGRSLRNISDAAGLLPLPLSLTPGVAGAPKLPPIPHSGILRLEPLSSGSRRGRSRSGSGGAFGTGAGKRPLSSIEEWGTPTP